jgi:hypothetical protein
MQGGKFLVKRKYVIKKRPRRSVAVSIAASKKGWRSRRKRNRAQAAIAELAI